MSRTKANEQKDGKHFLLQTEVDMTFQGFNRLYYFKRRKTLTLVVVTSFVVILSQLYVGLNSLIRKNKVESISLDYNVFMQKQDIGNVIVQVSEEYQTQICKRPKLSLLNDAIQEAFYKLDPLVCTGNKLFYLRDGVLLLNSSVLNTGIGSQQGEIKEFEKKDASLKSIAVLGACTYFAIERVSDDYSTYTESVEKTEEPFDLIIKHDFIRVQCSLNKTDDSGKVADSNMHEDYREEHMNRHLLFTNRQTFKRFRKANKTTSLYHKGVIKENYKQDKVKRIIHRHGKSSVHNNTHNEHFRNSDITWRHNNLDNDYNKYFNAVKTENNIKDYHFKTRRLFSDYSLNSKNDENKAENKDLIETYEDHNQDFQNDYGLNDHYNDLNSGPDIDVDFDQFLVQVFPKDDVFRRISEILTQTEKGKMKYMNVLIIGLDSMSNLAYQRKLPRTYSYLRETLEAAILHGYNIVGDATTAALIPMLTGKTETELPEVRKNHVDAGTVDSYPMIWELFKKKGYVTLFAEDEPGISAFNLRFNGFENQPTDHYMRPFWQTLWSSTLRDFSAKYCTGATPNHMFMFDYLTDFYVKYNNVSKFAFAFLSELTHWDNNPGEYLDIDLLNFLKLFKASGYLDNTLLIVMSDHGARYSKVRYTVQGKMEERLPMMSFVFPNYFQKEYPQLMKNLEKNSDRLSTPFDIYETLHDILDISRTERKPLSSQRGISLLQEIPLNRTCASAQIDMHWCTCLSRRDLNIDNVLVKKCADAVIHHLNQLTEPVRDLCVKLTLKDIVLAYLVIPNEKVLKYSNSKDEDNRVANFSKDINLDTAHYQITIETDPSNAMFEATILVNFKDGKLKVYPDISRLSLYGNQPACIQKRYPDLRKYCYCLNVLKEKQNNM